MSVSTGYSDTRAATALALAAPGPVRRSRPVVVTLDVGTAAAGGRAEVYAGALHLGEVVVSQGKGVLRTRDLPVGIHTLSAAYHGDDGHRGSIAEPLAVEVVGAATRISLVVERTVVPLGEAAAIRAEVAVDAPDADGDDVVEGEVTFTAAPSGSGDRSSPSDAPVVTAVPLGPDGQALWSPVLGQGTWVVSATFAGATGLAASTAASVSQVVAMTPMPGDPDPDPDANPDPAGPTAPAPGSLPSGPSDGTDPSRSAGSRGGSGPGGGPLARTGPALIGLLLAAGIAVLLAGAATRTATRVANRRGGR